MNRPSLRRATALAAALVTFSATPMPQALPGAPAAEFLQAQAPLSWVISAQGNRALAEIRAELRQGLREQAPPRLPDWEAGSADPLAVASAQ